MCILFSSMSVLSGSQNLTRRNRAARTKFTLKSFNDTATVRFRAQFEPNREEPIRAEDASTIFDWAFAISGAGIAGRTSDTWTRLPLKNARVALAIGALVVGGGRLAAVTIRQVDKMPPLDMLGSRRANDKTVTDYLHTTTQVPVDFPAAPTACLIVAPGEP